MKARFILELRYEPIVQAFDRRGEVLAVVHRSFKSKIEHWRIQNVEVTMADDFNSPSKTIRVGHLRSSITYEDPDSRQEFLDDSLNFLALLRDVFPDGFEDIKRIGFRSTSIMTYEEAASFEEAFKAVRAAYLCPELPLSIDFTDCSVTLERDDTRLFIGPAKKGEEWVKNTFSRPEQNVPEYGIGIDVDCFARDLLCKDTNALKSAARTLQDLALRVEEEALSGLT